MNLFKKTFIALLGIALAGGAFVSTVLANPVDGNDLTRAKAAEEVTTFTFSSAEIVDSMPITTNNVTVSWEYSRNTSNKPAYNKNDGGVRWYWGTKLILETDENSNRIISSANFVLKSGTIESKVTFDDMTNIIVDGNNITSETGVSRISFEINGTSGYVPIKSITVTTIEAAPEVEITNISLSGDMTKKEYYDNESWDTTGLIVKGNDGTVDINAKDITWTFTPEVPALGVTSVEVVANYNELSSNPLTIEGITVSEAPNLISDTLTIDALGVSDNSYTSFSNKTFNSSAVYSGSVSKSNGIQMNDTKTNGIYTSASGGKIKQISVVWGGTSSDRTLNIYASNEYYSSVSAFTNSAELVGSINNQTQTEYSFENDYQFVLIRSDEKALQLSSVTFVWEPAEEKEISSVNLSGTLEKTQYYTNEQWDTTGLVASVNYSDNESETLVVGHEFIFDPATPVLGTQQVKIRFTYEGFTSNELSFDVNVLEYVEPVYTYEPTRNPSGSPFSHDGVTWEYYFNEGSKLSSFQSGKGLHFGTGTEPTTSLNFFSDAFIKDNKALITRIDVNASTASANSEDVTLNVRVNNNVVGTTILTSSATDYSFVLTTPMWGHVEIEMIDNDPEHNNAAVYLKYIYIYATEDEVASTLTPVINALEDIHTCGVVENDEKFDAFLTAYKTLVDEYRTKLEDVIVYDYGFGDTSYSGNRLLRTDFITKYDACTERYLGAYNASPIIATYDNSTLIATIVVVSVVSLSALCVFFIYERKRRLSK